MLQVIKNIWSYILGIKLEDYDSEVSGKLELWLINGKKVLNSENANYSFDSLHRVFQKTFQKINLQLAPNSNVLILGFGAGSVAHILQNEYKFDCNITGVDLDPIMFEVAQKHFGMTPSNKLQFVIKDALQYMSENQKRYDLIVVDLFVDNKVPQEFTGKTFLSNTFISLATNGTLFINLITSHTEGKKQLDEILKYFNQQKGKTMIVELINGNSVICYTKS